MKELTREAYAKINFTLDVLGRLPNGYHTVRMVMQSISLHDDVTVRLDGSGKMTLRCSLPYLPVDHTNLAWRAANAFYSAVGMRDPGTSVFIRKRIPVSARFCAHWTRCTVPRWAMAGCAKSGCGWGRMCRTACLAVRCWPRASANA